MDAIVAGSIFFQHGSFLLPASYALGSGTVALSILKSRNFAWTWFESFVSGLVVVCLVVWAVSGPWTATIASTAAVLIAGFPLVGDCYRKPWEQPFLTFSAFMVTNVLGTVGAKAWSVEERLYPAACTVYCLLVLMLISRKFFSSRLEIQSVSPLQG